MAVCKNRDLFKRFAHKCPDVMEDNCSRHLTEDANYITQEKTPYQTCNSTDFIWHCLGYRRPNGKRSLKLSFRCKTKGDDTPMAHLIGGKLKQQNRTENINSFNLMNSDVYIGSTWLTRVTWTQFVVVHPPWKTMFSSELRIEPRSLAYSRLALLVIVY